MPSSRSPDHRVFKTPETPETAPTRRAWRAAMEKGLRRDIFIATLGFVFGSVLVGLDATIPVQDESAIARNSATSA